MSIRQALITIRVAHTMASCDACGSSLGAPPWDVKQSEYHHLKLGQDLSVVPTGPVYTQDGAIGEADLRRVLVAQGWTLRKFGKQEFVFCPDCKEVPEKKDEADAEADRQVWTEPEIREWCERWAAEIMVDSVPLSILSDRERESWIQMWIREHRIPSRVVR